LPGAALIVDDDAIERGIEKTPVVRRAAAARSAVQEDGWDAAAIARLLPVHRVQGIEREPPATVGPERRVEEIVARDVIAPHYSTTDIRITQSIFTTRRPAGGPAFKGGLSR